MKSKADGAYELLLEQIEVGALAPGEFLSESSLIDRYGLSRTPLRESLQRLNLERMIEIIPGRGVQVASNSVDAQLQRLELRRPIEVLAYVLACERASAREIDELRACAGELRDAIGIEKYCAALRSSQEAVVAASHNDYLIATMAPLHGLSRRFWLMHLGSDEGVGVREGKRHHLRALEAVVDRKPQDAQEASVALNEYLTEFALQVLAGRAAQGASALEVIR